MERGYITGEEEEEDRDRQRKITGRYDRGRGRGRQGLAGEGGRERRQTGW